MGQLCGLIPMKQDTGAINRLHFCGAGFWYVSVSCKCETGFVWYKIPVPLRTLFIIYVAFSRVYFRHQKFAFQTYVVRKTGTCKWSRFIILYGTGFCNMHHGYKSMGQCWLPCPGNGKYKPTWITTPSPTVAWLSTWRIFAWQSRKFSSAICLW